MAPSIAVSTGNDFSREPSFLPVIIISLAFHAVVFVGIPVLTLLLYHSEKYQRPPTFQLVSMKAPKALLARKAIPKVESAKTVPKKVTTPVPRKNKSKPSAKNETKPQENDDLSELLSSIPATTVSEIAFAQNFKSNWYIQNVQSRIEDNFKPPAGLTDKKDVSLIASFTIFNNGNISKVSITQSSGTPTLDNIAIKAVQISAPFGQLPMGFSENKLDVSLTLYYTKQAHDAQ
jgi:TonB family C-terminal domain